MHWAFVSIFAAFAAIILTGIIGIRERAKEAEAEEKLRKHILENYFDDEEARL